MRPPSFRRCISEDPNIPNARLLWPYSWSWLSITVVWFHTCGYMHPCLVISTLKSPHFYRMEVLGARKKTTKPVSVPNNLWHKKYGRLVNQLSVCTHNRGHYLEGSRSDISLVFIVNPKKSNSWVREKCDSSSLITNKFMHKATPTTHVLVAFINCVTNEK